MNKLVDGVGRVIMVLLGTALCAFSMGVFVLPYNMLVPGVTGIGRLAEIYFGSNVTAVVSICNAVLLLLGLIVLGILKINSFGACPSMRTRIPRIRRI